MSCAAPDRRGIPGDRPAGASVGVRLRPVPGSGGYDGSGASGLRTADSILVGAGYKIGAWTIDLAYMYLDKKDRTVNNQVNLAPPRTGSGFNGTWTGDAHLVSLDVGYKF